jgi:hypothetical protein
MSKNNLTDPAPHPSHFFPRLYFLVCIFFISFPVFFCYVFQNFSTFFTIFLLVDWLIIYWFIYFKLFVGWLIIYSFVYLFIYLNQEIKHQIGYNSLFRPQLGFKLQNQGGGWGWGWGGGVGLTLRTPGPGAPGLQVLEPLGGGSLSGLQVLEPLEVKRAGQQVLLRAAPGGALLAQIDGEGPPRGFLARGCFELFPCGGGRIAAALPGSAWEMGVLHLNAWEHVPPASTTFRSNNMLLLRCQY